MPMASDLAAAVDAGIITREQADKIAALAEAGAIAPAMAAPAEPVSDPDEESFHFARGFQDVFLTIGIALLLVGAGIGGTMVAGPGAGALGGAVLAFALAWHFARRRRLVLPSIALALGFAVFAGVAAAVGLGGEGWRNILPMAGRFDGPIPVFGGGVAAGVAAAIFFALYRLPFALGLVAVAMLYVVIGSLTLILGPAVFAGIAMYALLVLGLIVFAVAMAFDLSDPKRRTLRSDYAFWLHLVAAPMIVHSIIALLVGSGRMAFSLEDSILVIAIVVVLGFVALVIDRRALLVAGLGYLAFAIGRLLSIADIVGGGGVAVTLLLVGATVVVVGAGWRPIRRWVVTNLVTGGLRLRLPPASLA